MEMFDKFDNIPEGYIPNNRPRCIKPFKLDIMTGETASHSFEVPFDVQEECLEYEVIYKLGLKQIIIRNSWTLDVQKTEKGTSIITCNLSSDETKLFENSSLKARVQLKFYLNNNAITFSEIYNVTVRDSLEVNRRKPGADDTNIVYGTGYGYTED